MISKVIVTKSKLNAIGDMIRKVIGNNNKYTLDEMPKAIKSINNNSNRYIHLIDPVIQVNSFVNTSIPIVVTEVIPYES
jgi:hypothetical protein